MTDERTEGPDTLRRLIETWRQREEDVRGQDRYARAAYSICADDLEAALRDAASALASKDEEVALLTAWKEREQRALLSMAATLLSSGFRGDGVTEGVDWLAYKLEQAQAALASLTAERDGAWRCFHCNEVFTGRGEAQEHFGDDEYKTPACRMAVGDVALLRHLESERDGWQRRALYAEEQAGMYDQLHAENMRLTKGHGVFMALDYLEGEKLVLRERAEQAEAQLTALQAEALASPPSGMAALIEEMRTIAMVAGQCSVEGLEDTKSLMAAAEAERCERWANQLSALASPAPRTTTDEKGDANGH